MNDERQKASARRAMNAYIVENRMRHTAERDLVLEAVFAFDQHFTVEQIYQHLQDVGAPVSVPTIYAALNLLEKIGIVCSTHLGGNTAMFERRNPVQPHHHLICRTCGKVKEVRVPELYGEIMQKRLTTFAPEYFELNIYGQCSACMRRRRKTLKKTNNDISTTKHKAK